MRKKPKNLTEKTTTAPSPTLTSIGRTSMTRSDKPTKSESKNSKRSSKEWSTIFRTPCKRKTKWWTSFMARAQALRRSCSQEWRTNMLPESRVAQNLSTCKHPVSMPSAVENPQIWTVKKPWTCTKDVLILSQEMMESVAQLPGLRVAKLEMSWSTTPVPLNWRKIQRMRQSRRLTNQRSESRKTCNISWLIADAPTRCRIQQKR